MSSLSVRLDFFVTRECRNACVFCCESELMTGRQLPFADAVRTLAEERRRGAEVVQFLGGEPTLHERFPELAQAAKRMGMTTFVVTNGGRFSDPAFCERAFPWLDEIMVSVHGWDRASHEAVTRGRGAWANLRAALGNAGASFKGRLIGTTTVVGSNADGLGRIAELCAGFGAREYQVLTVVPKGRGDRAFARLHPRYRRLGPAFARLSSVCRRLGVELRFSGVPLCALGPDWRLSHDLYENFSLDARPALDRPVDLWREPGAPLDWTIELGRVKPAKCAPCALAPRCGGVYAAYQEAFGDDELVPF